MWDMLTISRRLNETRQEFAVEFYQDVSLIVKVIIQKRFFTTAILKGHRDDQYGSQVFFLLMYNTVNLSLEP